jgi:hypothetical protein
MVVDGEGRGIPVLHGFVKNKDMESISFCLQLLLKECDASLIKCFVVDKDMAEISALNDLFPNVPVSLCHSFSHLPGCAQVSFETCRA